MSIFGNSIQMGRAPPLGSDFTLSRIYIDTPPNKLAYSTVTHDVFDPTGMVVKVDIISSNYEYNGIVITDYTYPTRELTTSDTSITISYTDNGQTMTCEQAITVIVADSILNNNTWEVISQVAKDGNGDTFWDLGDCKQIILNGKIGNELTLTNFTTYVYILDFNHPINKTIADNNIIFGGFKTALTGGKDICLCDNKYERSTADIICFNINHWGSISNAPYNTNYGGWKGCDFRYDILGATSTPPSVYGTQKHLQLLAMMLPLLQLHRQWLIP